jgi:hypothetical protein
MDPLNRQLKRVALAKDQLDCWNHQHPVEDDRADFEAPRPRRWPQKWSRAKEKRVCGGGGGASAPARTHRLRGDTAALSAIIPLLPVPTSSARFAAPMRRKPLRVLPLWGGEDGRLPLGARRLAAAAAGSPWGVGTASPTGKLIAPRAGSGSSIGGGCAKAAPPTGSSTGVGGSTGNIASDIGPAAPDVAAAADAEAAAASASTNSSWWISWAACGSTSRGICRSTKRSNVG